MTRATSVEDYKLFGSFEAVRKTLLDPRFEERWEKPLAYWALPSDRRLPLAFLGRTVRELLDTPFEELCATPGIGQKKIQSLVKLLHRATKDSPALGQPGDHEESRNGNGADGESNGRLGHLLASENGGFDADRVSEALWARWRDTVLRHRLECVPLGRLAPSLQNLPTVIWQSPLRFYADRSLAEIRALRTHGEKRVRVVLEVFYVINKLLAGAAAQERLAVRIVPRFVADIEYWLEEVATREEPPRVEEVQTRLAGPLLEQIRIDIGDAVYDLAASRLGLGDEPQSVRVQSRRLGVTRARVYQLLDECSKVMLVRWPIGRSKLRMLEEHAAMTGEVELTRLCHAVRELFYPDKYELAARASDAVADNGEGDD